MLQFVTFCYVSCNLCFYHSSGTDEAAITVTCSKLWLLLRAVAGSEFYESINCHFYSVLVTKCSVDGSKNEGKFSTAAGCEECFAL